MRGKSLYDFPLHLGGGRAVEQPEFTGEDWYDHYLARHPDKHGQLVSMFRFEEPWTSWEMHPSGDELVCCLQGQMTLHQELPDGSRQSVDLGPGEYAINLPGAWHTADAQDPVVALFITTAHGTTHRPR